MRTNEIVRRAAELKVAIPAFNIPYLPMMEPVVRATRDEDTFSLLAVARLEWIKFESGSMAAVRREYERFADSEHVRLHLDHIPVIDEDDQRVDYIANIREALDLGYESVMIDGSRLPFDENVAATARVVEAAHAAGVPVEAELGAVLGHEAEPSMSYEEIVATRAGFTDPEEAARFVRESSCDWLSVAFGNIHGHVSKALRDKEKVAARLDIEHLERIRAGAQVPLVLHGGSGISTEMLQEAVRAGIAKVNVGTDIRQVYERTLRQSGGGAGGEAGDAGARAGTGGPAGGDPAIAAAREAVYERTRELIREHFRISGMAGRLLGRQEG